MPSTSVREPLEIPPYGYERNGVFYRPKIHELLLAFLRSVNPFESRLRWTNFISLLGTLGLAHAFIVFVFFHFNLWSFVGFLVFIWLVDIPLTEAIVHRGFNHKAFRPRSKFTLFVLRMICVLDLPDELFQISHTVHHKISDRPGDPFNARGGLLSLMLTDFLQQHLRRDLTEHEYRSVVEQIKPLTFYQNTYRQYQRWGSVTHPFVYFLELCCRRTVRFLLVTSLFGGQFLAYFAAAFVGGLFVRTMNYFIHGGGEARHREGVEFHREDLSYNHWCLILVMGQRHNYHHQFPRSANTAFLPWQIDHSFYWIKLLEKLGLIVDVVDSKESFLNVNKIEITSLSTSR